MLKSIKKGRLLVAAVGLSLAATSLAMWGCGTSGYDSPNAQAQVQVLTNTDNALVTAAKLKEWVDAGLVNKAPGSERVVILDLTTNEISGTNNYTTVGHIPGAQLISSGSGAFIDNTRAEGPMAITGSMVIPGATMDALIQSAGIDANTTIVFTNGNTTPSTINEARAYTTFRYWGFPKSRLKVLQGGNTGWTGAGYTLTTVAPTIRRSTYGVAQNGTTRVNTDMRVSLGEMIGYVRSIVAGNPNNVILLDTIRGAANPPNFTATVSSTTDLLETGYTPFDGAIKGSYNFPYTNIATGLNFKTAADLTTNIANAYGPDGATQLGQARRDAARTFIVFCRAGNAASVAYFALDGIAYYNSNVDVKWYDGSLGQWNLMASSDNLALNGSNAGGQLAVGSIWDTTTLMDNLTWNKDRGRAIVNYSSRVYAVEPSFEEGNQIETEDRAYRSAGSGSSGSSSSGGGC